MLQVKLHDLSSNASDNAFDEKRVNGTGFSRRVAFQLRALRMFSVADLNYQKSSHWRLKNSPQGRELSLLQELHTVEKIFEASQFLGHQFVPSGIRLKAWRIM